LVDERCCCHSITLFTFCWKFLYFGSIIKVKLHLDRQIRRSEEILFKLIPKAQKHVKPKGKTMMLGCAYLHICTNTLQYV
jgi:hypothetical protein